MADWAQDKGWITGRLSELTEADARHEEQLDRIEERQRNHSQRLYERELETVKEVGKLRVEVREDVGEIKAQIAGLKVWAAVGLAAVTGIISGVIALVFR